MTKTMKGSIIAGGHQAVTKGILRDTEVEVFSKGGDFYNQNDFPLLYWLQAFGEWFKNTQPKRVTRSDIEAIWRKAKNNLQGINRIVIAQTPAEVDKEYLERLDGGILHEAFHSMYTLTGDEIDLDRVEQIITAHFDADVPYGKKLNLLKRLNNIFEDAYIERQGLKRFRGGFHKVQKVHELIWEKEEEIRQHRPMGEEFINKEGERVQAMRPIGHMTCYLRDRCEYYLNDAPMNEYDEDIRRIVDSKFASIIRDSKHSNDSYDTMELAFRTVKLLHELHEERKKQQQQQQGQGQGSGGSGGSGSGKAQRSKGGGSGNNQQKGGPGGGPGHQKPNKNGPDPGQGSGQEEEEEEEQKAGASGNGPEEEEEDGLEDIDDDVFDSLSGAEDADEMEDGNSALSDEWEENVGKSAPDFVFPYSEENDRIIHVDGDNVDMNKYDKAIREVRKKTTYIRPKMLSFFRGKRKSRTIHGTKSGRRLSSRKLSSILKAEDPSRAKPFRKKVNTESRNSAVSLLIDESGSMRSYTKEAREILLTLSQTIGTLKIPHEVIGFTSNDKTSVRASNGKSARDARYEAGQQFSRVYGCDWRIYRTFDEPFNVQSYKKMMDTSARGLTPIPDALDFAGKRILPRREDQKIIFMVTDGSPEYNSTNWYSKDYLKMTENHVEALKSLGVETMFIGIGYAQYVEEYPNSLYIRDSNNFASKMATFIFEQMKRIKSGR